SDALCGCHEIRGAFLRHLRHEFDDGLLDLAIVPGRKRVTGLRCRQGTECQGETEGEYSLEGSFHCHSSLVDDSEPAKKLTLRCSPSKRPKGARRLPAST